MSSLSNPYPHTPRSNDPNGIIPKGSWAARVVPLNIQIRTMAEYDIDYMRDRIVSEVFVNRTPTRIRAVAMAADEACFRGAQGMQDEVDRLAPELERMVIDELSGRPLRAKIETLEKQARWADDRIVTLRDQVDTLEDHIHRIRWWQVRRWWAAR